MFMYIVKCIIRLNLKLPQISRLIIYINKQSIPKCIININLSL